MKTLLPVLFGMFLLISAALMWRYWEIPGLLSILMGILGILFVSSAITKITEVKLEV